MLKKLALASFAIILTAGSIALAQLWPSFPIVDGASYCSATNNNVCTNTVPAGPTMTGNETVPADTNLAGGGQPQTVKLPLVAIGAGKVVVSVPLTGATVTVDAQTRQLIVNPAGTIAALTVNLPAAAGVTQGQRIGICGTQIVTTLTMGAGTGNTFSTTAPTAMLVPVVTGAASCFEFVNVKSAAAVGVWHRTQ
jgi:hypothetical protein